MRKRLFILLGMVVIAAVLTAQLPTNIRTLIEDHFGWYNVRRSGAAYTGVTIAAALTDIGVWNRGLYLQKNPAEDITYYDIAANLTIPKNIPLMIPMGVRLRPAIGINVHLESCPVADYQHIFVANGTTSGTVTMNCSTLYSEWYGAITDDNLDDKEPLQLALNAAETLNARVMLQIGTYDISDTLTVEKGLLIQCESYTTGRITGEGTRIRASDEMTNMLRFSGTPLPRNGGLSGCLLDANGFADWAISIDGWRGLYITHNQMVDTLVGCIHTELTGISDYARSSVENNICSVSGANANVPNGEGASYFMWIEAANGRTTNPIRVAHNQHTGFGKGPNAGSSSIYINGGQRIQIVSHFFQPFEDTGLFDCGVRIENSSGTSTGIVISDLTGEWGSQEGTGVCINGNYSGVGSQRIIEKVIIRGAMIQPNNKVVTLDVTGSNAAVIGTVIKDLRNDFAPSDTIEILDSQATRTSIEVNSASGSHLDTQIITPVDDTTTAINSVITRADISLGTPPSSGSFDVGEWVLSSGDGALFMQDKHGTVREYAAHTNYFIEGWITSDDTTEEIPVSITGMDILAQVVCEEAFNSSGTDQLDAGFTAGTDGLFNNADVSGTGLRTITPGANYGLHEGASNLFLTYTPGGTAATEGACHVTIMRIPVSPVP
jgi:hypothetical protein